MSQWFQSHRDVKQSGQGVKRMLNIYRTLLASAVLVVAFILIMFFIGFFLKIALLAALLAFAYYWFMRALQMRRRKRF